MKTFEAALDTVIKQFGKDIITEKRFVSVLADYNAFKDTPAIRNILLACIQEGLLFEIHKIINRRSWFSSREKKLNDAGQCLKKYRNIIKKKVGANKLTDEVISILAQNLIPDNTNQNTQSANATTNTLSTKKQMVQGCRYKKEEYTLLELLLLSNIGLIGGNAIYITYVEFYWWMAGAFILSIIFQGLLLVPIGLNVRNCNDIVKSLYLSVIFVATINTLMPILLMFQPVVDFYSNFTWDYDGDILYNLYSGKKYEGGVFVILCILLTTYFYIMWMLYVTNSNEFKVLVKFITKKWILILLGIAVEAAVFVPYLYISYSSYMKYDEECIKLDNKIREEISRVQKIGNDRINKDINLSFMGIKLGSNIVEGKHIAISDKSIDEVGEIVYSKIGTNGFGVERDDSLCFPECSYFEFKTTLNGSEVDVCVNAYQNLIYNICIKHKGWGNDEELEKIYSNKYGEPTRDSSYIRQEMDTRSTNYYERYIKYNHYAKTGYSDLENDYQEVDEDLYWIFKNHSISISKGGTYITYVYDSLQKKAELYKNGIMSKAQEIVHQREIEQAKKDSLDKVIQERKNREIEKAANIKQYNDI